MIPFCSVSLALEYSGKATLLYRHHYGDEHERTKKSFEFFTTVYAEAGKEQYSESMEKAEVEVPNGPRKFVSEYIKSLW